MADIFTDGPVFEEDQGTVFGTCYTSPGSTAGCYTGTSTGSAEHCADQTDTADGSPDTAGQEPAQGVEEVPDAGTVDYTALLEQLIQQNEKQQELMETLVKENKKLEQDMKNIPECYAFYDVYTRGDYRGSPVTYTCFLYPAIDRIF